MFALLGIAYFYFMARVSLVPVLTYLSMMVVYCFFFRKIAILDVMVISVGFVLRLLIGGGITSTPISNWIIIMVFLLALLISFSKRRNDLIHENGQDRMSLNNYNISFINTVISILVPIIIVTYILYCTSDANISRVGGQLYLTTIFVIAGFLRYLQLIFVHNLGGDPVQLIYDDSALKIIVVSWISTFGYFLYF
jgi:4-hydroxybenzoate polyprenyltransferase